MRVRRNTFITINWSTDRSEKTRKHCQNFRVLVTKTSKLKIFSGHLYCTAASLVFAPFFYVVFLFCFLYGYLLVGVTSVSLQDTPTKCPKRKTNNRRHKTWKRRGGHVYDIMEGDQSVQWHVLRDRMIWIPKRCEVGGCDVQERLFSCRICGLVMYCSDDHMQQDSARHGIECKYLSELPLWGCIYEPAKELERYPIGCFAHPDAGAEDIECKLCGCKDSLCKTECCGQTICNVPVDSSALTYPRETCSRAHRKYTLCSYHYHFRHAAPDWRECTQCAENKMTWLSHNGYNFTPLTHPPKGRMFTQRCSTCYRRIHQGFDVFSVVDGQLKCKTCCS